MAVNTMLRTTHPFRPDDITIEVCIDLFTEAAKRVDAEYPHEQQQKQPQQQPKQQQQPEAATPPTRNERRKQHPAASSPLRSLTPRRLTEVEVDFRAARKVH